MASYSNTNYTNDYFDTTGYFNPTSQTSSNIDIDELDTRYLQKSGGTISNNLLVNGSVDIQTSLTIPNIGNVENAISGKQPTINANDLAITDTAGLTTALAGKQPTIEDGDLTIAKTDGLQTALDAKQATIDEDTDLTSNSLTTTDLVVNESLNIDNVITYEKYKQFDTLVLRRVPTSDVFFNINEIQVWVNDTNIMYQNASTLNGYFAVFEDNSVELEADAGEEVDKVYNNIISTATESVSPSGTDSIIIKSIPLTFVKDI